jgi:hypothetical protein
MYSKFNEYIWILRPKLEAHDFIKTLHTVKILSMKEILSKIRILKSGRHVSFRKNE